MLIKRATTHECEAMFRRDIERRGHRPFDDRKHRYDRYRDRYRAPRAAISFIQNTDTQFNSTSGTKAYTSNISSSSLLLCLVCPAGNTGGTAWTLGVSDNVNGTWSSFGSFFSAFNGQAQLFGFPNAAPGATTVTVTTSVSGLVGFAIAEYGGIATSSPADQAATGTNQTTNVTSFPCPNVTTANANDLILACLAASGSLGTTSVGGAYTLRAPTSTTNGVAFADQIVSSTNTYTGCTFTIQFGQTGWGITATFKAFAATPPPVASIDFSPGAGGVALRNANAVAW